MADGGRRGHGGCGTWLDAGKRSPGPRRSRRVAGTGGGGGAEGQPRRRPGGFVGRRAHGRGGRQRSPPGLSGGDRCTAGRHAHRGTVRVRPAQEVLHLTPRNRLPPSTTRTPATRSTFFRTGGEQWPTPAGAKVPQDVAPHARKCSAARLRSTEPGGGRCPLLAVLQAYGIRIRLRRAGEVSPLRRHRPGLGGLRSRQDEAGAAPSPAPGSGPGSWLQLGKEPREKAAPPDHHGLQGAAGGRGAPAPPPAGARSGPAARRPGAAGNSLS